MEHVLLCCVIGYEVIISLDDHTYKWNDCQKMYNRIRIFFVFTQKLTWHACVLLFMTQCIIFLFTCCMRSIFSWRWSRKDQIILSKEQEEEFDKWLLVVHTLISSYLDPYISIKHLAMLCCSYPSHVPYFLMYFALLPCISFLNKDCCVHQDDAEGRGFHLL